jgi:hypothetical protein
MRRRRSPSSSSLAAAHEADARRVVELMREGVAGRCGDSGEIEYAPSEQGHVVRVNARPILLLHGDALEMVIGDDQSLKIEVLLNTVLSAFAFPFVTEFDGDNACPDARWRVGGPRAPHRALHGAPQRSRRHSAAPLLSALASSPTMPSTPRGEHVRRRGARSLCRRVASCATRRVGAQWQAAQREHRGTTLTCSRRCFATTSSFGCTTDCFAFCATTRSSRAT